MIEKQNVLKMFNEIFNTNFICQSEKLSKWSRLLNRSNNAKRQISIALVGKYTRITDTYMSVIAALQHAGLQENYKVEVVLIESDRLCFDETDANDSRKTPKTSVSAEDSTRRMSLGELSEAWEILKSCDGVLIPGGFGDRGIEGKLEAVRYARENNVPFLGICLGMQCAVIEFARNVLNLTDANSMEFNEETNNPVIIRMLEYDPEHMGGTMRLGLRTSLFIKDCHLKELYSADKIEERHRHRFEMNEKYLSQFTPHGLDVVAVSEDSTRMEVITIKSHKYFYGVQFHPEFLSKPERASPPFLGLIKACVDNLNEEFEPIIE